MGTNYYIHKENRLPREDLKHIGKSVWKKPAGEFLWAIHPDQFRRENHTEDLVVIDEEGKKYSYYGFIAKIGRRGWNYEHVGEEFS